MLSSLNEGINNNFLNRRLRGLDKWNIIDLNQDNWYKI